MRTTKILYSKHIIYSNKSYECLINYLKLFLQIRDINHLIISFNRHEWLIFINYRTDRCLIFGTALISCHFSHLSWLLPSFDNGLKPRKPARETSWQNYRHSKINVQSLGRLSETTAWCSFDIPTLRRVFRRLTRDVPAARLQNAARGFVLDLRDSCHRTRSTFCLAACKNVGQSRVGERHCEWFPIKNHRLSRITLRKSFCTIGETCIYLRKYYLYILYLLELARKSFLITSWLY